MADKVASFIQRMKQELAEDAAQGMSPPVELRRLRTVVKECGTRSTRPLLSRLGERLAREELYTEPPLSTEGRHRDDWIRFSTGPFPADALLFPRERDLHKFVETCLGAGVFRDLEILRDRRRVVGREYRLPDGRRIDLLFQERGRSGNGALVAIELKRDRKAGTVEQMIGYIDALRHHFPGREVRGLIISGREDRVGASLLPRAEYTIEWYTYQVSFKPLRSTGADG